MADLGTDTSLKVTLLEIEKKVEQAETDRDNLKTNLSNKGIDVTELNKMSELISKVQDKMSKKLSFPIWHIESMKQHDVWLQARYMPQYENTSLAFVSVFKHENYVYAATNRPNNTSDKGKFFIMKYDIDRDSWTQESTTTTHLSYELQGYSSNKETIDNKVFFIGGYDSKINSSIDQNVWYDIVLGTWSQRAVHPEIICDASCCAVDKKIHVLAGSASINGSAKNTHRCYDTVLNVWTNKANLLKGKKDLGIVKVDNLIHIFGGVTGSGGQYYGEHDCYDINMNMWTSKTSLPYQACGISATYAKGMIYLFGGYKYEWSTNYYNYVYSYDVSKDSYKNLTSMIKPRYGGTVIAYENLGYIYYLSGYKWNSEDSSPNGNNYLYII